MRSTIRLSVIGLAIALTAGCAAGGEPSPGASTGTGSPAPAPTTASPSPSPTTPVLTLVEGASRSVCGIVVRVRFVPPSVATSGQDQAFLVAEPVAGGASTPPADDQPTPSAVAPMTPSAVVTVLGQRFMVVAVDVVGRSVRIRALC